MILPIIFILILASLIGINVQLHELIRISKSQDFTVEDAQVKAMTEQVAQTKSQIEEAISELPSTKTKRKS